MDEQGNKEKQGHSDEQCDMDEEGYMDEQGDVDELGNMDERGNYYGGDMRLREDQEPYATNETYAKSGILNTAYRWPNGIIPYVLDTSFSAYSNIFHILRQFFFYKKWFRRDLEQRQRQVYTNVEGNLVW